MHCTCRPSTETIARCHRSCNYLTVLTVFFINAFLQSFDPLAKWYSFCWSTGLYSVRLATEKCHWSFETFDCMCVSRWSVKERWAAAGLALPARRMSLCLMSTLAEPAFSAPGPQMTSLVSARIIVCLRRKLQDLQCWIWVTHTHGGPKIPLASYALLAPLQHTYPFCTEIQTNSHVLYIHGAASYLCQHAEFGCTLIS